jgi:hypothetical protein
MFTYHIGREKRGVSVVERDQGTVGVAVGGELREGGVEG